MASFHILFHIVLYIIPRLCFSSTVVGEESRDSMSVLSTVGHFLTMFIGSACIGIAFALLSAFVSLKIQPEIRIYSTRPDFSPFLAAI